LLRREVEISSKREIGKGSFAVFRIAVVDHKAQNIAKTVQSLIGQKLERECEESEKEVS
jgi:hypothetical protein